MSWLFCEPCWVMGSSMVIQLFQCDTAEEEQLLDGPPMITFPMQKNISVHNKEIELTLQAA